MSSSTRELKIQVQIDRGKGGTQVMINNGQTGASTTRQLGQYSCKITIQKSISNLSVLTNLLFMQKHQSKQQQQNRGSRPLQFRTVGTFGGRVSLGVVHKLRGQDEVGRQSVKCPRQSTKDRQVVTPMSTWTKIQKLKGMKKPGPKSRNY